MTLAAWPTYESYMDTGIITSAYINLRPKAEIYPAFLHYLLHSYDVKKVFYALGSGLRQNLSYDDFKYLRLPIPSPGEQRAIAAFLDEKCAKVDEAVRIKEEQIALLRERRQILIQQAVTRGLNPAAPMKDSGVEWLGRVPSSWALTRLGGLFDERKSKVSDKDFEALSVTKNGILPQLENAAKTNDGDNRKLVKAGDFVINSRSDRKGSSGVSPLDGSVSLINIVLKPKGILPEFCNHILKSHAFVEEYYRMGHGIVADLWTTRYDEMRAIIMALPSPEEQRKIVAHIDEASRKIENAIAIKEEQIAALKEYKTSLINAAVTGKIKVT